MPGKIHHGSPGSYKTSGAILDDFIPAVYSGRVVVTNVRGLNNEQHIIDVLNSTFPRKKIPSTFELVFIDTDTVEGIELIRSFWHWADCGTFFLIDEAQTFWPSDLKEKDWTPYDYPGGRDNASLHGRPSDFLDAWTRHRHFNWDFCLTSPDIELISKKVRLVLETAFRHKNQAIVGVRGWYLEGYHLASNGGQNSSIISISNRRIPAYVFKLYQSTSTGAVSDSTVGKPFWKSPKILGLFLFLVAALAFLLSRPSPIAKFTQSGSHSLSSSQVPTPPSNVPISSPPPAVHSNSLFDSLGLSSDARSYLVGRRVIISGGSSTVSFIFEFISPSSSSGYCLTSESLLRLGFVVKEISPNLVSISKDSVTVYVYPKGRANEKSPL